MVKYKTYLVSLPSALKPLVAGILIKQEVISDVQNLERSDIILDEEQGYVPGTIVLSGVPDEKQEIVAEKLEKLHAFKKAVFED